MAYWTNFLTLYLLMSVHSQSVQSEGQCSFCVGEQFECINENCYCANGYVPNYYNTDCTLCPGLGENCYGPCCNENSNETLTCWRGICQICYDAHGNWICRDPLDQIILVSGTQIIMAIALVLGIIVTFTLLYKLCAVASVRSLGADSNESRLSVGSLQVYVNERLRDAPPSYSRAAPSGSAIYPAAVYLNAGFVHDNSLPPPPYTPERKNDNEANTSIHM